jgi:membrane protease YdiL (CAAX protease family)
MKSTRYKFIELSIIFILIPISFTIDYFVWVKLIIGLIGLIYILLILLKVEKLKFKISPRLNWKQFASETLMKLIIIIIITTAFVYLTDKSFLFNVVLEKPKLWIFILLFYSIFSVYPQELIYRTFFFKRYSKLFTNKRLFIFLNAILFALGHLFFRNTLVLFLTFLGGLLFAITFNKTNSTILVSIEHAIYGCWLFTVGMGEMLGFPA